MLKKAKQKCIASRVVASSRYCLTTVTLCALLALPLPSPAHAQENQLSKATLHLFDAVQKGDLDSVYASIDNGANLTARNEAGQTPGDLAVSLKRFDILKFLMSVEAANKARESIVVGLEEDLQLQATPDEAPATQADAQSAPAEAPTPVPEPMITKQKQAEGGKANPFAWVVNGTATTPSLPTNPNTATPAATKRIDTTTDGKKLPARFSWVVTQKNDTTQIAAKVAKPKDELDQFPFDDAADKGAKGGSKPVDPNDLFGDLSLDKVNDTATGDATSDNANELFGDLNQMDGTTPAKDDEGIEIAQATPPVRKPQKKIELLPATGLPIDRKIKLMITRVLLLDNVVKMKDDGKKFKEACIGEPDDKTVFCAVPAFWPKEIRRYTDVTSIMYQGFKAITRYDDGKATRYHAFFDPKYYKEIIAYYQDQFGAPTEAKEKEIHPFAKPPLASLTAKWVIDNPETGEKMALEIIQHDNTRSAFPDMTRGAIMLYKLPKPALFPKVSPLDFLLRNRMADVT